MNKLHKPFLGFILLAVAVACNDDVTKVFNNCNVLTFSDGFNDADTTFVDLGNLKVDFKDDTIIVTMEMANIPSEITFNNDALAINALNFFWEVAFDIDQSGARDTGDLSFMISKFKFEQGEVKDNILNRTQKNVWEQETSTKRNVVSNLDDVSIIANTVTIRVPLADSEKLKGIECDTKAYFFTGYYTGARSYGDQSPN